MTPLHLLDLLTVWPTASLYTTTTTTTIFVFHWAHAAGLDCPSHEIYVFFSRCKEIKNKKKCGDAECVRHVIERPFALSPPAVVPWCSFSHLVLFSAQIGDAWAIIALCSGRVTMGAEPSVSPLCLTGCETHPPPNEQNERQLRPWWMFSMFLWGTDTFFAMIYNNLAKICKQIKFAHNTV